MKSTVISSKVIFRIIIALLIITFVIPSCSDSKKLESDPVEFTDVPRDVPQVIATEVPITFGNLISVNEFGEFTLNGIFVEEKFNSKVSSLPAEPSRKYVEQFWTIKNTTYKDYYIKDVLTTSLVYDGLITYEPIQYIVQESNVIHVGNWGDGPTIAALEENTVSILFEVPNDVANHFNKLGGKIDISNIEKFSIGLGTVENVIEFQKIAIESSESVGEALQTFYLDVMFVPSIMDQAVALKELKRTSTELSTVSAQALERLESTVAPAVYEEGYAVFTNLLKRIISYLKPLTEINISNVELSIEKTKAFDNTYSNEAIQADIELLKQYMPFLQGTSLVN